MATRIKLLLYLFCCHAVTFSVAEDNATESNSTVSLDFITSDSKTEELTSIETTSIATVPVTSVFENENGHPACRDKEVRNDNWRHFAFRHSSKKDNKCDKDHLQNNKWYAFQLDGNPAKMLTDLEAIKHKDYCGTDGPIILKLGAQKLPKFNESVTVDLCVAQKAMGKVSCLSDFVTQADVVGCSGYYVYSLHKIIAECSAICIKRDGETVHNDYLLIPIEDKLEVRFVSFKRGVGVVTIEYQRNDSTDITFYQDIYDHLPKWIAYALNYLRETEQTTVSRPKSVVNKSLDDIKGVKQNVNVGAAVEDLDKDAKGPGPGALRRKRDVTTDQSDYTIATATPYEYYNKDDIQFVKINPREKDNSHRISFYVEKSDSDKNRDIVLSSQLKAAIDWLNNTEAFHGLLNVHWQDVIIYYEGYPRDVDQSDRGKDLWQKHYGLFIAIIILVLVLLLALMIGYLCIKCSRKQSTHQSQLLSEEGKKKKPLGAENPLTDEEIQRTEAPTLKTERPPTMPSSSFSKPSHSSAGPSLRPTTAEPSRGSGEDKPSIEDQQGWVVPLNDLGENNKQPVITHRTKL